MRSVFKAAAAAALMLSALLTAACTNITPSDTPAASAGTDEPFDIEIPEATDTPVPVQPTELCTPDPTGYVFISEDELNEVIARNTYVSEAQRTIVESALSLVGRVDYFWGGKSYVQGFDPDWGTPREVTSPGDSTTGQIIPYGLDCSGFICWCGAQLGRGISWTSTNIGEGTWHQWEGSRSVDMDKLRPGDIVFQNEYPGADGNHVGIVVGFRSSGEPVIVHCSSICTRVVATTPGEIFRFYRRFSFLDD